MLPRLELMLTGNTDFPVSLKVTFPQLPHILITLLLRVLNGLTGQASCHSLFCSIADSIKSLSLQSAVGLVVCRHSQVYSSVQVHRSVPGHCWERSALGKDFLYISCALKICTGILYFRFFYFLPVLLSNLQHSFQIALSLEKTLVLSSPWASTKNVNCTELSLPVGQAGTKLICDSAFSPLAKMSKCLYFDVLTIMIFLRN